MFVTMELNSVNIAIKDYIKEDYCIICLGKSAMMLQDDIDELFCIPLLYSLVYLSTNYSFPLRMSALRRKANVQHE